MRFKKNFVELFLRKALKVQPRATKEIGDVCTQATRAMLLVWILNLVGH